MRYEHKTETHALKVTGADKYVQAALERASRDGWECVNVLPINLKGTTVSFVTVMKRPAEVESLV